MILNIQSLDSRPVRSVIDVDQEPDVEMFQPTEPPSTKFHNSKPPTNEIQKERAIHRTAAYMLASGAKLKTIAFELGVSESAVSNWSRQPWFQALVTTIIHNEFSGDLSKLLKSKAVESVLIISDLAQNSTSDSVRLKAAQDLVDRFRGKATNFVHHSSGALSEDPAVEIKRLEEDLLSNGQG